MNTSKNAFRLLFFAFVCTAVLAAGCKEDPREPDDPHDHNEEELITTVELSFTDSANTSNTFTARFADTDGPGGNAPVVDSISLDAQRTYLVSVSFLDESEPGHSEDITAEVLAEDDEHIVCYTPAGADLTVERTDSDGTYEVGLESRWRSGAPGPGTVQVVLKHQPDGAKDGTCTPGETDVDVTFSLQVL